MRTPNIRLIAALALAVAGLSLTATAPASAAEPTCTTHSLGGWRENVCITPGKSARVETRVLGILVGKCTLTRNDPHCDVTGSVSGFRAHSTHTLDPDKNVVTTQVEYCVPEAGCQNAQQTSTA